jgi:hypothetical protein
LTSGFSLEDQGYSNSRQVEKRLGDVNSSVFLSTEDAIRFQMADPETADYSGYIWKWWNRLRLTEQA